MRVLVAIDNSEESFNALKWILDYFLRQPSHTTEEEKEPSTKLSLVHVMEPFPQYAYPVIESATRAQAQEAARILARASEMCKDKMVKAETLILEGDPKNMLCEATEKMNIDLLAVGSRGLGQIKRLRCCIMRLIKELMLKWPSSGSMLRSTRPRPRAWSKMLNGRLGGNLSRRSVLRALMLRPRLKFPRRRKTGLEGWPSLRKTPIARANLKVGKILRTRPPMKTKQFRMLGSFCYFY
ncbi:uncharacterized protein LOC142173874 isoform X2 [Nicotiana tabacum]|uniref:Uncharacterized protein LOC142173874 isoform X2 n=1 Tax=Nicotiana tabacum TaxID=4097 RepID=A0AC58TF86_TOBAC